jgi:ribosomal protein S18 acetylase RimI-like enzyme
MRPAQADDLDAMLDTLVPAFARDPLWGDPLWGGWAFPAPADAERLRRALFRLWLEDALSFGGLRVTANCEAVAAWFAPAGTKGTAAEEESVTAWATAELGRDATGLLTACASLEAAHPQDRPHCYLSLLGVHARHRGRGLGLGLLRESLAEIDAAGLPAYLESTATKNLPLYEGLGFRRIGAVVLPDGGPRVDQLWREPLTSPDGRGRAKRG